MSTRTFLRFAALGISLAVHALAAGGIYHDGWTDFNKNGKRDPFEDASQPVDRRVEDLLSQMTLEEKTCQLATLYGFARVLKDAQPTPAWKNEVWKDGIANIDENLNGLSIGNRHVPVELVWPPSSHVRARNAVQRWFVEETRLGIPVDFTNEGLRGICHRKATNFPAPIAIGASFNLELARELGEVTGAEGAALGYTNIYAPIIDLARDPRWGRVVECFGEDPFLVTEMGLQLAKAIQAHGVASTVKHFAVYSEPKGGRDGEARTDPHIAPREMEMLHLWPYERLVREAGILGIMSSYNDYDGVPVSGSAELMVGRLRRQWGFRGYVVSDSNAVRYLHQKHRVAATHEDAMAMFLREGGNVRTEFNPPENFILPVRGLVRSGKLDTKVVDERVRDVLRVKFLVGLFDKPYADEAAADRIVRAPAHLEASLRAAREGIVLLRNTGRVLPLGRTRSRILVCGPSAEMTETSRDRYGPTEGAVVSILEGIRAAAGDQVEVLHAKGCETTDARWPESELYPEEPDAVERTAINEAVQLAASADVVILVVGDSNRTIGESKSRTSLDLPGHQNALGRALVATGKPVVTVLATGRPVTANWLDRHSAAVLEVWFGGEWAGKAVAEVLFGDYNPAGRLPVTFPRSVGQVPFNFPYKPGSQAGQSREFSPNGYGNSQAEGAMYSFGHGLSYTQFTYSDVSLNTDRVAADGSLLVSFTLENSGDRAGDEVVQLYVEQLLGSVTTYELNLRGFKRVFLKAGERRRLVFTLPVKSLEIISRDGTRRVEPGEFEVSLGASSVDLRCKARFTVLP